MFGSLVIVFPTKHEGGALMLQHGGSEWIFDLATMIQTQINPSITYVAFYSNVKHEVTAVTSGYHVTLTYNLSFSTRPTSNATPVIPTPSTTKIPFKRALSMLLSNKTFMEQGQISWLWSSARISSRSQGWPWQSYQLPQGK